MNDHTCDLCNEPVIGRSQSARYCSPECRTRAKRCRREAVRRVPCRGCGEMKATDAAGRRRGSVLCRDCRRETPTSEVSEAARWERRKRTPCSRCHGPTGWSISDRRVDPAKVLCRTCRPSQPHPGPMEWKCGNCGKQCHRGPVRGQRPRYCSIQCQRCAADRRRRARVAKAFVEDVPEVATFVADGYRCHLCGRMTDKTKVVPHPKAPTIDHVLPLNKGGTHERANCRTACFRCNVSKQDRGGGEQFALVLDLEVA